VGGPAGVFFKQRPPARDRLRDRLIVEYTDSPFSARIRTQKFSCAESLSE
jgi:hypothetical protein